MKRSRELQKKNDSHNESVLENEVSNNTEYELSLKSLITPKSPKGDFLKLLIFSGSPLGVRGKNGKNQQFEGFLDRPQILIKFRLVL